MRKLKVNESIFKIMYDLQQFVENTDTITDFKKKIDTASYAKLIQDVIAEVPDRKDRILEIGIGYAHTAISLRYYFPESEIFAVEYPDRNYVNNNKFIKMLENERIKLFKLDITSNKLPFESEYFDVITFCEVIEHLPPTNIDFVFSEISRVLKSNGVMICTTDNGVSLLKRLQWLCGKSPFDLAVPDSSIGNTYRHIRFYTVAEIEKYLLRNNMKIDNVKFSNYRISSKMTEASWKAKIVFIVQRILSFIFPKLKDEFMIIVKNKNNYH